VRLIEPGLADDAFLRSVAEAREGAGSGRFHLWWLGQSGFLLHWNRRFLLLDPYLSDSLAKKYAGTDKPHVRMTRRVVDPSRLAFVDAAASSHNHTDHLDGETLGPLLGANSALEIAVGRANRDFAAERLGVAPGRLLSVDDGTAAAAAGFELNGIASAHEAIERDAEGACRFLGFAVRFGPWTVYHSGDTVRYEGMAEKLRRFAIDVALLPINGADPARRVAGNLSGSEAAELARDIGARLVIPCHYEMFEFNTASPEDFAAACGRLAQPFRILRAGERWSSAELGL